MPNPIEPNDQDPFQGIDLSSLGDLLKTPIAPQTPEEAKAAAQQAASDKKVANEKAAALDPNVLPNDCPTLAGEKAHGIGKFSEQVRQTIVRILEKEWPAAFAKYGAIKYQHGDNPTPEQRALAYTFAFRAFMALSYKKSSANG